jgi:hypothetical protein
LLHRIFGRGRRPREAILGDMDAFFLVTPDFRRVWRALRSRFRKDGRKSFLLCTCTALSKVLIATRHAASPRDATRSIRYTPKLRFETT